MGNICNISVFFMVEKYGAFYNLVQGFAYVVKVFRVPMILLIISVKSDG